MSVVTQQGGTPRTSRYKTFCPFAEYFTHLLATFVYNVSAILYSSKSATDVIGNSRSSDKTTTFVSTNHYGQRGHRYQRIGKDKVDLATEDQTYILYPSSDACTEWNK